GHLHEQQTKHRSHPKQHEHRGLHQEVDQVTSGQVLLVEDLEDDRDEDEAAEDGQDPGLTAADPLPGQVHVLPHPELFRGFSVLGGVCWCRVRAHRSSSTLRLVSPVVIRSTTIAWLVWAAGRTSTSRPCRMTAIRSATSNTSSRLCEPSSTACPRSTSVRTRSRTIRVCATPSAAVGSSMITSSDCHSTALAI